MISGACHPKAAAAPAAATRAAARPGGSVYCACHAKGSRGPSGGHARRSSSSARPGGSVYCACHAKGSRGPSGGHARRSSSRRLCVLRGPSGGHARRSSSRRLCVLRLPRERSEWSYWNHWYVRQHSLVDVTPLTSDAQDEKEHILHIEQLIWQLDIVIIAISFALFEFQSVCKESFGYLICHKMKMH